MPQVSHYLKFRVYLFVIFLYFGRKITLIPPFHSRNTEAIVRDPITEREAVALMGAHTIGKVGGFRFINDVITTHHFNYN